MAHLKEKSISDNSCKAIIIDTLLDSIQPLSKDGLAQEIRSDFQVLIPEERLTHIILQLLKDGILYLSEGNILFINPVKESEFKISKLHEKSLQDNACRLWIDSIKNGLDLSEELRSSLIQALPIFLRSLFIRHGVISYELLISQKDISSFDVGKIAADTAAQFPVVQQAVITKVLPTVFQCLSQPEIMDYLKHNIDMAVGYISEVISDETATHVAKTLKDLTLYLDTNTLYRLLNLQGQARYESIEETIGFCKDNGVCLKVSAMTKKELTHRLEFDARVLTKFPSRVDLAACGYKYRTSDNYVSTYWKQSTATGISVNDFISYYQNFDLLLRAKQIEVEDTEIGEEAFLERTSEYFEKMSLRDLDHEKGDFGLWHDAYNIAYVQRMQRVDAKTAIDTGCLFLTTDHSLTALQQEDVELRNMPPISISPSQLLQIFCFTRPICGYEETFVKFFASSSLGISFTYDNNDIQEILSRISHYHGIDNDVAEKILRRELINCQYRDADTDEGREEIVYKDISEELITGLKEAKEQLVDLQSQNTTLDNEQKVIQKTLAENAKQFSMERSRLQAEKQQAEGQRVVEEEARKLAEQRSDAQQELYADDGWASWKKQHLFLFWGGIVVSLVIIVLSIYLSINKQDNSYYGLLGLLPIPGFMFSVGCKLFTSGIEAKVRKDCLEDYTRRLASRINR